MTVLRLLYFFALTLYLASFSLFFSMCSIFWRTYAHTHTHTTHNAQTLSLSLSHTHTAAEDSRKIPQAYERLYFLSAILFRFFFATQVPEDVCKFSEADERLSDENLFFLLVVFATQAAEDFRKISEAYERLSDENLRRAYDSAWMQMRAGVGTVKAIQAL